jgi:hypothetical protein
MWLSILKSNAMVTAHHSCPPHHLKAVKRCWYYSLKEGSSKWRVQSDWFILQHVQLYILWRGKELFWLNIEQEKQNSV